jgi:hypothetical protein
MIQRTEPELEAEEGREAAQAWGMHGAALRE